MNRKVLLCLALAPVQLKLDRKDNPSARLGANLRRIFVERGLDFFDRISGDAFISSNSSDNEEVAETKSDEDEHEPKTMKYEDLREMREEILKNLACV